MQHQPFWHTRRSIPISQPLKEHASCDALVIGGGFAGLQAAYRLAQSGVSVILLEKTFCGGSTSGLSSGFLTPDSELPLHVLINRYGRDHAAVLWSVAVDGVDLVVSIAQQHDFNCDLEKQDSLFVSVDESAVKRVNDEYEARQLLGYDSTKYDVAELAQLHPGGYTAGVSYPGTWTLDPFAYCQEMRELLLHEGVRIHEHTEVLTIDDQTAVTAEGSVTADDILVCIDKLPRRFNSDAYRKYHHARTWLAISAPLRADEMESIFPQRPMQCWDSTFTYTYYRPVEGNRLLVGGGSALKTLLPGRPESPRVINRVLRDFTNRFPSLRYLEFTHYWSGAIDITGDLLPLADTDPHNSAVHYVMGCAGLPWAAWCGDHTARRAMGSAGDEYSRFFGWKRELPVSEGVQRLIGKLPAFAVNVFVAKS